MIRKARIGDVKEIQKLLTNFASRGEMLSRSLSELYEALRDFYVFEEEGRLLGTSALHIVWEDLAEVRSVAVAESAGRRGIGSQVVGACIEEARSLGLKRLFCLTYKPDFFAKFGFKIADKSELPHKVWGDCIKCVKFPDCDEIAMILEL
ncbi:N-acetyltransferase [Geomonas subterranea]|uniref:N-acetyltransferase n=1 Tax=Geomonas subterranea TaxID=2847989 RepID=A0ABX8LKG6_9BACT|nr:MULTISPECIES: N-acetyltransferase [Geomonas]QXE92192.1 N-acetyltransferase [Geomonas subterranea]QXM09709.1 N-acetyltransferase [Geomonas subterranea]